MFGLDAEEFELYVFPELELELDGGTAAALFIENGAGEFEGKSVLLRCRVVSSEPPF